MTINIDKMILHYLFLSQRIVFSLLFSVMGIYVILVILKDIFQLFFPEKLEILPPTPPLVITSNNNLPLPLEDKPQKEPVIVKAKNKNRKKKDKNKHKTESKK